MARVAKISSKNATGDNHLWQTSNKDETVDDGYDDRGESSENQGRLHHHLHTLFIKRLEYELDQLEKLKETTNVKCQTLEDQLRAAKTTLADIETKIITRKSIIKWEKGYIKSLEDFLHIRETLGEKATDDIIKEIGWMFHHLRSTDKPISAPVLVNTLVKLVGFGEERVSLTDDEKDVEKEASSDEDFLDAKEEISPRKRHITDVSVLYEGCDSVKRSKE